jgi:hypothetical protein
MGNTINSFSGGSNSNELCEDYDLSIQIQSLDNVFQEGWTTTLSSELQAKTVNRIRQKYSVPQHVEGTIYN